MPLIESFSGIRGIYDDGLDEKVAARYAYSYLSLLKNKYKNKSLKIVIGTDTRPSRYILKNAIFEVLDCDIIDIGIASTPMTEFAVRHFKVDGGIIITASHNEPYWNGFKFLDNDGAVLRPTDMEQVIRKYASLKNSKGIFGVPKNSKNFSSTIKKINKGTFFNKHLYKNKNPKKLKIKNITKKYNEINDVYSDYVLSFLSKEDKNKIKNSKLKIIIDPDGGTGIIAKTILEKLNVKVHGINMKHSIFNRTIEPTEDSLFYLSNEVRDKNYDFAAGFDCDADRVEIMTSKGMISGNQLLALIAGEILKDAENKAIVVNDATSLMVRETAKKHNAKYIETQVGEINVVDKIYELKAPVGGEGSSSGVIIPDSRCRDGVLTLIYLLKIIADKGKKLEELVKELPEFYNIKKKVQIKSKGYTKIKKKLISYYRKKQCKIKDTKSGSLKIFIDGNSFILFRESKTEAGVLRVISDAPKKGQAEALIKEALNLTKNK
jgi:phosphomannomutase